MAEAIQFMERDIETFAGGALKLNAFRGLLEAHREKQFRLVLPDKNAVPVAFHITEVAHVQKRFIDCGGKLHTTETCQLQVWLGPDTEHRLQAGKMADVLNLSGKVLPEGRDLDIEFEYEDTTISQYPVVSHEVTEDEVVFNLGNKHTDCLARELCLPSAQQTVQGVKGCCGPSCC